MFYFSLPTNSGKIQVVDTALIIEHVLYYRRKPRPKCTILSQFWPWLNKWIFLPILQVLTNASKAWLDFNLLNPIAVNITNVS